jgi:hypothetical protein
MSAVDSRLKSAGATNSTVEHAQQPGQLDREVGADARADVRKGSLASVVVRDMRLLLIAVWLGAALFFSFAVAPSAFRVLPTRELAAAIVGRTLFIVNTGGFVIGLLLLLSAPLRRELVSRMTFRLEVAALLLLTAVAATGQWIITARIESLRAQIGRPIDELAQSDPLRQAFASAHGLSVLALSTGMIAALVALLLIARRK